MADFPVISFIEKLVHKWYHTLMGEFPYCEAFLYTKSNLPVLALTTSKGFKIGPSKTEISRVSKRPRTLRHPVDNIFNTFDW